MIWSPNANFGGKEEERQEVASKGKTERARERAREAAPEGVMEGG